MVEVQTLTKHDILVLRVLNNEVPKGISCGAETNKSIRKLKLLGFVSGKTCPYVTQDGRMYLYDS